MPYTRREAGAIALSALPGASLLGFPRGQSPTVLTKPNSVFGGVQVGIFAPASFGARATTNPEELLKAITGLGVSAVELQFEGFEMYLGAPSGRAGGPGSTGRAGAGRGEGRAAGGRGAPAGGAAGAAAPNPATPAGAAAPAPNPQGTTPATPPAAGAPAAAPGAAGQGAAGQGAARGRGQLTPEQQAEAAERMARDELRRWRLAPPVEKFRALRQLYEDAGVAIQLVRYPLGDSLTDDELDYGFQAAKWLGARGITCEPAVSHTRRIGIFAEKHKLMVGYYGRTNVTSVDAFGRPGSWEQAFFYSRWNGATIDTGHFMAANNASPAAFIRRYHDRITNIHLRDRKMNGGPNVTWGQGDTPIAEILQMVKRERFGFMATIVLDYPIPTGSDATAEIAKCVQFCRDALK